MRQLNRNTPSHTRRTLDGLILDLYAAPANPDGWLTFLHGLCSATRGSAVSLISHDLRSQKANISLTTLTDADAIGQYKDRWAAEDPWAHSPHLAQTRPAVVLGDQLLAHSEMKRTAFYNDFARHHDVVRCLVGVIENGPRALSGLSINGSEKRGPFGSEELALFNALMPHLHRALQLHRRLTTAEAKAARMSSVLDRCAHGIFMVDAQGAVTYMNTAASRLARSRDGVLVDGRELRTATNADMSRLRTLVANAANTSAGLGHGAGGALRLERPSGKRALSALVSPVPGVPDTHDTERAPVAMIVVSDPDRVMLPDEDTLAAMLEVTPGEARLSLLLAQGLSLEQAAGRLGVRVGTIRTRLKSVFEKTGTHRQSELVLRVLGAVPRL